MIVKIRLVAFGGKLRGPVEEYDVHNSFISDGTFRIPFFKPTTWIPIRSDYPVDLQMQTIVFRYLGRTEHDYMTGQPIYIFELDSIN